jgi:hypothetical protein
MENKNMNACKSNNMRLKLQRQTSTAATRRKASDTQTNMSPRKPNISKKTAKPIIDALKSRTNKKTID